MTGAHFVVSGVHCVAKHCASLTPKRTLFWQVVYNSYRLHFMPSSSRDKAHYPSVLVIVQKARETSTNISRYCRVPCVRSSVTLVVFFQVTVKGWIRNLLLDISV